MYLPNPIAIVAVRTGVHAIVGLAASMRAELGRSRIGMAFAFAVLRSLSGWVIGFAIYFCLAAIGKETSAAATMIALAIPRLALSAFFIHALFRPRGGWRETALWAVVSVAASSAVDAFLLSDYANHADWLRMTWC